MATAYIVKVRDYAGAFEARSMMGTRRGIKFSNWRTLSRHETREAAEAAKDRVSGLREAAIFQAGKRLGCPDCEAVAQILNETEQ